jgi:AraC family L-rhamnose operon transcriptional activator RhaR
VGVKHDVRGERPIEEHSHDFAEVVVVVEGTGVQTSTVGDIQLEPGTVVMVRPGAWHGTPVAERLEYYNLYLSPELFFNEMSWILESPYLTGNLLRGDEVPGRIGDETLARVTGWFAQLDDERRELRRPALVGLASCILSDLDEAAPGARGGAASPPVLAVMTAMAEDVARPWTIAELADVAALSASQLHRRFVAQVGRSVIAWLDQLRGEQAARFLARTDASVSQIGSLVGWGDPSYAARRFRRLYGMTPLEYRARFRDAPDEVPPV